MGITLSGVQNLLDLWKLGYLDNKKSVIEFGSQELHLKEADLLDLISKFGFAKDKISSLNLPNIRNWPNHPRTSSKYLYELLGFNKYYSLDLNNELNSINHDFNKPFEDKNWYSQFDVVTDHCACGHAFNIAEAYKTIHKLCKKDGLIISILPLWNSNAYYLYDSPFFQSIAAANSYKIIYMSYIIDTGELSEAGSSLDFHIPLNNKLLNTINKTLTNSIAICAVLQKTQEKEFQYPYQEKLMSKIQNHSGFNRAYTSDPLSYYYIPTSGKDTYSSKELLIELLKRIKRKLT